MEVFDGGEPASVSLDERFRASVQSNWVPSEEADRAHLGASRGKTLLKVTRAIILDCCGLFDLYETVGIQFGLANRARHPPPPRVGSYFGTVDAATKCV